MSLCFFMRSSFKFSPKPQHDSSGPTLMMLETSNRAASKTRWTAPAINCKIVVLAGQMVNLVAAPDQTQELPLKLRLVKQDDLARVQLWLPRFVQFW
jgi:hypothetical protein